MFSQIKDIKHIKCDFHYVARVIPQGVGLGVAGGQNFIFSKHGHVAYQIEGDCEQNGIQVKCSPYGQPSDLEMESIGQLSLNFFESVGCLRWHPIHYAITRTDVSKFGDCC